MAVSIPPANVESTSGAPFAEVSSMWRTSPSREMSKRSVAPSRVTSKPPPSTHVHEPGPKLDPSTVLGFKVSVIDGAEHRTWESSSARCSIGAQDGNDLVVGDPTVSRFHCEISMDATQGPRIRD